MDHHEQHAHRILTELEAGRRVSQRSLSRDLGIALGLTNLLLRRLIRKGWVRVIHVQPNRVMYLLTPAGIVEKARMSRAYLRHSVQFYAEARNRIQTSFSALVADAQKAGVAPARIIFCGAGELAEVGYVCLQESELTLVGVVDDERVGRPFFGHTVHPARSLTGDCLAGEPYHWVVVVSLDDAAAIDGRLASAGVDPNRVFWV